MSDLTLQKRLASKIFDCSPQRVWLNPEKSEEIKKAITSFDIRRLIAQGDVRKFQIQGVSRGRAKQHQDQKRKGRHYGPGSRKGKTNARRNTKDQWVFAVRTQRDFIQDLRGKSLIEQKTFKDLYAKVKGGFFRSVKHMKIYMNEQKLFTGTAKAVKKDGNK